jgi:acetylglutamate kinase
MKKQDIENLPALASLRGQTVVLKLSGRLTEDKAAWSSLANDIAICHQLGLRLVLLHGGGKQIEELAQKMQIPQQVIQGRRITDDATLELAKMTFAGKINTEILASLHALGVPAIGLSGVDAGLVLAHKRPPQPLKTPPKHTEDSEEQQKHPEDPEEKLIDFGHVGDIDQIQPAILDLLLTHHYLPVIASLGVSPQGAIFNINADTIAAEIALALKAHALVLLSDTHGIYRDLRDPQTRIPSLSLPQAQEIYTSPIISAGMLPKLKAILSLLQRGLHTIHLIHGLHPHSLLHALFTPEGSGTRFHR